MPVHVRKRKLINIIKEKYHEFTDEQKRSLRNITIDSFQNSQDIVVLMEQNAIRTISSHEILYISEPKNGVIFIHTLKEKIEYKSNAFNLLEYVEKINSSFRYLNNRLVVNIDKISYYNSYRRKIYFENDQEADVTGAAMKGIIQKELGKEKDSYLVSLNVNYEY